MHVTVSAISKIALTNARRCVLQAEGTIKCLLLHHMTHGVELISLILTALQAE